MSKRAELGEVQIYINNNIQSIEHKSFKIKFSLTVVALLLGC
jgi:hypothetical protein